MRKKVFLVSPFMDKGYSLQVFHPYNVDVLHTGNNDAKELELCYAMRKLDEKWNTRGFFQGRSTGWIMLEFWTDDHDAILSMCMEFANAYEADLCLIARGDLTIDEIEAQRKEW